MKIVTWEDIRKTVDGITKEQCLKSGIVLYKVMRWSGKDVPGETTVIDEKGLFQSLYHSDWMKSYQLNTLTTSLWPMFCFDNKADAQYYVENFATRHIGQHAIVFKVMAFDQIYCPLTIYAIYQTEYWEQYQLALHQDDSRSLRDIMAEEMPMVTKPQGAVLTHGLVPVEMMLPWELDDEGDNNWDPEKDED